MLACAESRTRIAQWISGEMKPEDLGLFEAHLRACPACSAETESVRRTLAILETDDPPDPGVLYWSSFGGRLRTRIAASTKRRRALRLATLAAAAALVAALALVGLRREIPSRQVAEGPVSGAAGARAPVGSDLSVTEAEARLDTLLRQAAAEGQDPRDLEAILDEVVPAHPLDGADALGPLSPEDGRSLSEDLLDTQG